jgi:hypothetical protein
VRVKQQKRYARATCTYTRLRRYVCFVVMTQAHSFGELLEAHICDTYGVA